MPPVLMSDASLKAPQRLPRHVAIVMDGNGRWAQKRFLPRVAGHRQGVGVVAADIGDGSGQLVERAARQHHLKTGLQQCARCRLADARAGAGYQRHLVRLLRHLLSPAC